MERQNQWKDTETFLNALKSEDERAFAHLYRSGFPQVADFVFKNSGSLSGARDVFQEAVVVFLKYLRRPHFDLTVQVNTFLLAIAKRMWLQRLRDEKRSSPILENQIAESEAPLDEVLSEHRSYDQQHELVAKLLNQSGKECQSLLKMFYYEKLPMSEIASRLGYTDGFVRVKKVRCLSDLRKRFLVEHDA